uniref:Uncharacterized protein n=1 Tax=Arundo donax TaxID=35708 RepID=A0A0A9G4N1_ARUDO
MHQKVKLIGNEAIERLQNIARYGENKFALILNQLTSTSCSIEEVRALPLS